MFSFCPSANKYFSHRNPLCEGSLCEKYLFADGVLLLLFLTKKCAEDAHFILPTGLQTILHLLFMPTDKLQKEA